MVTMRQILSGFLDPGIDPISQMELLLDSIRPSANADPSLVVERITLLIGILESSAELKCAFRQAVLHLLGSRRSVVLLATVGIYPETGLFSETNRKISQQLLPDVDDGVQLDHLLALIFRRSDAEWILAIPEELWRALLEITNFVEARESPEAAQLKADFLEALRVVAHRVAAAGLDPEMLRLLPELGNHASPFLAVCEEVLAELRKGASSPCSFDERHIQVLLDQSRNTIRQLRRKAQSDGASFALTFRLRRLSQHIDRLERMVSMLARISRAEYAACYEKIAVFVPEILLEICGRNDLGRFWRENTELVALRVTENAGKSGEHYITETRSEYLAMLRAAAGGGVVIALMAAVKIAIGKAHLAPLAEVLMICLNYGIGFVLIHLLHFVVATKQPAMTANAIAAVIGDVEDGGRRKQRDFSALVVLIARTVRTQLVAILGNIGLAIPIAVLCGYLYFAVTGVHFVDPVKANSLLADIQPFSSGALVFAAIAGVCLFLAGLIAGYYDNLCSYNRIPQRLFQLHWPTRLFGKERWQLFTNYVGNNLGAMAGNFFFGFLLGGVSGLGMLLSLPLDIRHIAFSSANWGYALTGLEFGVGWKILLFSGLGVLLIGFMNLLVSFYLAIWIALKSRSIQTVQHKEIYASVWQGFRKRSRDFFLPPEK
jgi:site-specific recombinase